jgi:hypothetical protein
MKYWGFLAAKLAVAGGVAYGLWFLFYWLFWPKPSPFLKVFNNPFLHDLKWTTAMLVYFLICNGLLYLVILDQKYRCRTCLRRLRMPVFEGSWPNMLLIGRPRTEYICPYGHGTLKVSEVHFTGNETPDWQPHDDIWSELTKK